MISIELIAFKIFYSKKVLIISDFKENSKEKGILKPNGDLICNLHQWYVSIQLIRLVLKQKRPGRSYLML